jgi:hypothetical protein
MNTIHGKVTAEARGEPDSDLLTCLEKVSSLARITRCHPKPPHSHKGKVGPKGATGLNLFLFDSPRLSLDIDLN